MAILVAFTGTPSCGYLQLFNAARFEQMFLINVSRGGIVFEQEPLNNSPLFTLNNFIPTLRIAAYTNCSVSAIGERCVQQIIQCISQEERSVDIVNSL